MARSRSPCPEGEKPDSRRPDHHSRDGQRRDPKHPLLGSSRARGTRGETRELARWTPLDMNGKWLLMELRKSFCCATRASQKGRFDAFAKPSAIGRSLRTADDPCHRNEMTDGAKAGRGSPLAEGQRLRE